MKSNYCFDQLQITQPCAWRNYQTPLLLLRSVITLIADTRYSAFDVIAVSFDRLSVKLLHWAPSMDLQLPLIVLKLWDDFLTISVIIE